MTFDKSFALALALLVAGLVMPADAAGSIDVHNARARATVGAGQTSAVYMTVRNSGSEADRLVGVASTVADKTELHTTLQEQGVMKMRPLDGLDLPAGGTAEFKPGSNHVMLIGLARPLKVGDSFELTLRFEKAGEVRIEVPAVAPGDIPAMSHGGHGANMKKKGTE